MDISSALDKRFQVFVSSTYVDLVDERRAIIQALLELDCIPAGMEMFPAANEDQWSLIREVIDLSDYYVVVVGGRYGSTTTEGISYTEQEYDYAVASGIPVLGFVHADPGSIPVKLSEMDDDARERLDAFRIKVMTRMVKEYRTPDDLASVVSRGLIRAIKQNPRPGWVRGDHAMTDAVRAEMAELRAAIAGAERDRVEADARQGKTEIDTAFAHGDDVVDLSFEARYKVAWEPKSQVLALSYTWDEIVETIGPHMLEEAPDTQLQDLLAQVARQELLDMPDEEWGTVDNLRVGLLQDSWGHVLVQLRALGIIRAGQKKRTVADKAVYWTLTPAGDEYMVRLKATPRDAHDPAEVTGEGASSS